MGLFILFAPFLVGFALCISDGNADLPQHLLVDLAEDVYKRQGISCHIVVGYRRFPLDLPFSGKGRIVDPDTALEIKRGRCV